MPISSRTAWVLVTTVILFFSLIRIRLRDVPLERDEGEYAYAGQLMLQGVPPYLLAYNMKLPGTYAAYAAILAVFGQTPAAIHVGLLIVNAASTLLVFLLGLRLAGALAAAVAAASFALLSTSPSVLGLAGHATQFVILPALAGILLLLKGVDARSRWLLFASGLLAGTAFLMKQPGIAFVLFCAYCLVILRRPVAEIVVFLAGAVAPFAVTCGWLWKAGVLGNFWFWTFSYAREYGSIIGLGRGFLLLLGSALEVMRPSVWIWCIAAVGLAAIFWNGQSRRHAAFLASFVAFSFMGVSAGLYFRPHYFVLMLPAVSLLAGVAVDAATRRMAGLRFVPAAIFVAAVVLSLASQREYLFHLDSLGFSRAMYAPNPFPEAQPIAEYLRANGSPDAKLAILGSEPEIYFYSGLRSATGYIYTYELMEPQKYALEMQKEMIAQIEKTAPEFLIYVDVPLSWLRSARSQTLIFSWAKSYLNDHYERVGIVDIGQASEYRWDQQAKSYQPRSSDTVEIFRRKGR